MCNVFINDAVHVGHQKVLRNNGVRIMDSRAAVREGVIYCTILFAGRTTQATTNGTAVFYGSAVFAAYGVVLAKANGLAYVTGGN